MAESTRSLTFVVVAVVSVLLAWVTRSPDDITPEELQSARLGKPFFEEFTDPNEPTAIRVVTFNEDQATSRQFAVELKDGLWRIPSHNNYPADGADRLAKTATSLMGVNREEYIVGGETRHDEFGVVDPLDSDATRLKGRGQRVTLSKGDAPVLDLIIGKSVRERPGHRYLRIPSEKSVYVAKINPDLSTKFSDWVETNLLKLTRDDLNSIVFDNYSISEGAGGEGRIVPGEVIKLSREKSFDPWKLDGLDDPEKEVDTTKSNDVVSSLVDLKLTGVRPKPPGLNADLTIDRKIVKQQNQLTMLVSEMAARGFVPGPGEKEDDPSRLYSKFGELRVGTSKGLAYTLRFGEVFNGSESEIESGSASAEDKKAAEENKDAPKDSAKSGRYLLVSVAFDEKLIGPKPVAPAAPEENDEADEPADAEKESAKLPAKAEDKEAGTGCGQDAQETPNTDELQKEEEPAAAKPDEQPAAEEKPAGDQPAKDETAVEAKPDTKPTQNGETDPVEPKPAAPAKKSKEELKAEYDAKMSKYKADLADWEQRQKTGKQKAAELNTRFGEWYYVISSDSVAKLRVERESLIKDKKAEGAAPANPVSFPGQ